MGETRQRRLGSGAALVSGCCVVWPAPRASGVVIDDRSFFDAIPHTFLDFETTGDGTPLSLPAGVASGMNFKEYDAFGLRWSGAAFWGHESESDADAAIAIIGSLEHVVGWDFGQAGFFFPASNIRSFGFGMYFNTRFVSSPIEITATLFDGTVVESVLFDGLLIDGQIGDIAYGFVGFSTDVPITSITIFQDNFFAIDNLHLSSVPAPGAAPLLAATAFVAALRRRGA